MAREIRWTTSASSDVEGIADYIARDSGSYAAVLVTGIRDAARTLDTLPDLGRVVPELENPNIRELIVGSYRLIYRTDPEAVYILAVIHGARDLGSLWEREGR